MAKCQFSFSGIFSVQRRKEAVAVFTCLLINSEQPTCSSAIEQNIRLSIAFVAWHFLEEKEKDNNS